MCSRRLTALVLLASVLVTPGANSPMPPQLANPPLVVDSASDGGDVRVGDGRCRTAEGDCTLRAAIEEANERAGADTITFAIAGAGPHAIALTAPLPTLDDPTAGTTIDGYSQRGSRANDDAHVSNARLMIELVGPRSVEQQRTFGALRVTSAGNVVRGLALRGFRRSIWLAGPNARGNAIEGCFVGAGVTGEPWYDAIDAVEHRGGDPGGFGILLSGGAHHNRIGGSDPQARNVISGNPNDGIVMRGDGTRWNRVLGNLIGLTPDGATRLRNWGDGIDLNNGAASNVIGGMRPGEANVISGNHGEGIEISHQPETARNRVIGNLIGTDPRGRSADESRANTGFGVSLEGDVTDNQIGPGNVIANNVKGGIEIYGEGNRGNRILDNRIGVGASGRQLGNGGQGVRVRYHARDQTIGPGNLIVASDGPGVLIADDTVSGVTITRNVLVDNASRAIEIHPDGRWDAQRANADDANGGLAPPVLVRTSDDAVAGVGCAGCTIEVFLTPGVAGEPEASAFVGAGVADADGIVTIALDGVRDGNALTAIVTDRAGNSSELAQPLAVPTGSGEIAPLVVPGTIQAEDYRPGGDGVGYHDTTEGNLGGDYRQDAVDIRSCGWRDERACYAVVWARDEEWLEYEVNVSRSATFTLEVRVASIRTDAVLRLEIDGRALSTPVQVPDTGSLHRWQWTWPLRITLDAGAHRLRLLLADGVSVDAIRIA